MAIPLVLTDSTGTATFSAAGDGTAFASNQAAPAGASHIGVMSNFTLQTTLTGSPTTVNVGLEGSLDNSTWFELGATTSTSNDMFHVANKPVSYIRATVTTLSGGSTPTVGFKVVASM